MATDWAAKAYELEKDLELAKCRHVLAASIIEGRAEMSNKTLDEFAKEFRRWGEQEGYAARSTD